MPDPPPWFAAMWVFSTLGGIVAFSLLFIVSRTMGGFKRSEQLRCRKCRYLLVGHGGNSNEDETGNGNSVVINQACPECGCTKKPITRRMSGKQLRRRFAVIALLITLFVHCFGSTAVWLRIHHPNEFVREPWYEAITPTTVVIAGMPWSHNAWVEWTDVRLNSERPDSVDYYRYDHLPKWQADLFAWACNRYIDRYLMPDETDTIEQIEEQDINVRFLARCLIYLALHPDRHFDDLTALLDSGDDARSDLVLQPLIAFPSVDLALDAPDDEFVRAMVRLLTANQGNPSSNSWRVIHILDEYVSARRLIELGLIPDLLSVHANHDVSGGFSSLAMEIEDLIGTWELDDHTALVDTLITLLQHENPVIRRRAVRGLLNHASQPDAKVSEAIRTVLKDDSIDVREEALRALFYINSDEASLVNFALKLAHDEKEPMRTRVTALYELANWKRLPTTGIPLLLDALGNNNRSVRQTSFRALISTLEDQTKIIKRLRQLAVSDDPKIAASAKTMLNEFEASQD